MNNSNYSVIILYSVLSTPSPTCWESRINDTITNETKPPTPKRLFPLASHWWKHISICDRIHGFQHPIKFSTTRLKDYLGLQYLDRTGKHHKSSYFVQEKVETPRCWVKMHAQIMQWFQCCSMHSLHMQGRSCHVVYRFQERRVLHSNSDVCAFLRLLFFPLMGMLLR